MATDGRTLAISAYDGDSHKLSCPDQSAPSGELRALEGARSRARRARESVRSRARGALDAQ
eukprot:12154577-Alexandrium_andersonii.AAC.1